MAFAVLDRFEEDRAILLVGEAEKKVVFPAEELPDGLQDGDYVRIEILYDENRTKTARAEAESLLQELQQDK